MVVYERLQSRQGIGELPLGNGQFHDLEKRLANPFWRNIGSLIQLVGSNGCLGPIQCFQDFTLERDCGGFKVNPYEVEAALKEHPKVEDAVVYAAPSPQGDDVVCAIVVPPQACTTAELLAHCRGLIADYKSPARIEFRDSLPKSSAGKVLRSRL